MSGSRQIERTAAAWLARRDADGWSDRDQAALDAWLAASTAHRVAFVRLDAAWRQSARLKALGAGMPVGVVPPRGTWAQAPVPGLRETRSEPPTHQRRRDPSRATGAPVGAAALVFAGRPARKRPRPIRFAVAAAAVLLVTVSLALGWRHYATVQQVSYRTAIGGLQSVPMSDGSEATLSSDSTILVTLSRSERRIDLQQGEAFFHAAQDPGRPFVVTAGNHRVTAVGTRFAVRRDGTRLRVVVTEGLVRLESDRDAGGRRRPTTLLPAGSVALAGSGGTLVRSGSVAQAEQYLSWRSGYLAFHDTTLADAAAEFNRYNRRRIVMGDSTVAAMRVGGNFRWSNTDAFVRLLEQGFPVRAEHRDDSIVLRSR